MIHHCFHGLVTWIGPIDWSSDHHSFGSTATLISCSGLIGLYNQRLRELFCVIAGGVDHDHFLLFIEWRLIVHVLFIASAATQPTQSEAQKQLQCVDEAAQTVVAWSGRTAAQNNRGSAWPAP